jgi:4-hydroxy-3-methylbut-2-enyl diphosphate reductase
MRLLELDRDARRAVLSRRVILEEDRERARSEAYAKLKEGDVVAGRVTRLAGFGAFVAVGEAVEGLLHVSEIAWERVQDPAERLRVGEELQVQIIKLDREANRISLSLKALHPHPWSGVSERFPEGSIVSGKVVRLTPFGAFIRLAEGIDGLVHVSQLADRRINRPEEAVAVGQEIKAKVLKVDEENKRISLSMRALHEEAEDAQVKDFLQGQEQGGTTIADLIRVKQAGKGELLAQMAEAKAATPARKAARKKGTGEAKE